jgi:hypothetical protein
VGDHLVVEPRIVQVPQDTSGLGQPGGCRYTARPFAGLWSHSVLSLLIEARRRCDVLGRFRSLGDDQVDFERMLEAREMTIEHMPPPKGHTRKLISLATRSGEGGQGYSIAVPAGERYRGVQAPDPEGSGGVQAGEPGQDKERALSMPPDPIDVAWVVSFLLLAIALVLGAFVAALFGWF